MNALHYVSFHGTIDTDQTVSESFYLSFLPDGSSVAISNGIYYRFYEMEYQVVIEFWGKLSDNGARVDLLSRYIGFWQIYQLQGTAVLYMPHNLPVHENRCLPFATRRSKVPLQLQEGKVRTLLIGYKRTGLPLLLDEYPSLEQLITFEQDHTTMDLRLQDLGINYRFRDILQQMAGLAYRPFRIRSELGIQLDLLFQEIVEALMKNDEDGTRSQLALYHKALEYMSLHFMEDISKDTIANALNVSSRTLNRAFEKRPIKIADYIQRLRLNRARDMLCDGDMSVEEVANELNFPNRKYFSREFKKYFFDTPSTIKRENKDN